MLLCAALIHKCGQNTAARLRRSTSVTDLSTAAGPPVDIVDHDSSTVTPTTPITRENVLAPADLLDVSSLEGSLSLHRASTDPIESTQATLLAPTEYHYQTFLAAAPRIGSEVIDQSSFVHSSDFRIDYSDVGSIATGSVAPRNLRRRRSVVPEEIIDFSSLDGPPLLEPTVVVDPGPSSRWNDPEPPSPQSDAHWFILSKPLPPRPRSADSSFAARRRSIVYQSSTRTHSSLRGSLPSYDCTLQVASSSALQRAELVGEKTLSPDELLIEEYLLDGLTRPPPYSNRNSVRRSRSLDPVVYLEDEGLWEVPQRWPSRNPPQRFPTHHPSQHGRPPQQRRPAPMKKMHTEPPPVVPRLRPGRYYNGRSDFEDRKSSAKQDNDRHLPIRIGKVLPTNWRRLRNMSGG